MTQPSVPLAARMRPQSMDEFVGQTHMLGSGKPLQRAVSQGHLHSMILWGPPGTGKTTLARLLAGRCHAHFESLSAVLAGVKDIRAVVARAEERLAEKNKSTVLFVDEVHRFNKSQQDAFLPFVEQGLLTFIGATTENPSFEVNHALLSRARVYVLNRLTEDDLKQVLTRALNDTDQGLGKQCLSCADAVLSDIAHAADGDARTALNYLELCAELCGAEEGKYDIDESILQSVLTRGVRRFDKGGEAFYDQISALHKSVRGSAPDAALYWLQRMLDGGCDPLYVARRIVRMATEDIGNADPRALQLAMNAWDVQQRLGSPEGELALAQAVLYLACAPKSNAVYTAYKASKQAVEAFGSLPVPLHLRNAPTKLMKNLDYGKHYRYAHDEPHAYAAGVQYFPDEMAPVSFYQPVDRGLEIKLTEKLAFLKTLDESAKSN